VSLVIYALVWLAYFIAATVLYRVFLRHHLDAWFPNSARVARILLLVVLFSPALMSEHGELYLAPSLMAVLFQVLMKSPPGVLKAMLPWLLFGGIALWLDALAQRAREVRSDRAP